MSRRRVAAMVAAWVAVVALASSMAWFAIERAGREVLAGPSIGLGVDDGTAATGAPAVTTTTPPTSTSSTRPTTRPTGKQSTAPGPRGSTTSTRPAQVSVDRSAQVTGGSVGVRCTGSTVRLRYAQPTSGYTVTVKDSGPQRVEVEFTSPDRGTRVRAECSAGTPVITSDPRSGSGGGGGGDDGGGDGGSGGSGKG